MAIHGLRFESMNRLQDIIETFNSVDPETRLDLLLDFSNKLPPLPAKYQQAAAEGLGRVPECMTPVFLFTEKENGRVHILAEVAEEAPTLKGFISIIVRAYDGAPAEEIAEAPLDLVDQLGLAGAIRMNRAMGLSAIVSRIRSAAAA